MKPFALFSPIFFIAVFVTLISMTGPARAIEVNPLDYHFGEVEVGTSSSTIITIDNYTGHSHIITELSFTAGSSPDFSLATQVELPYTLESLERLELEVVFSPSVPGLQLAGLRIVSTDSGLKIVVVTLQGGPGTAPPPGMCAP
jgi:hypothetical protein